MKKSIMLTAAGFVATMACAKCGDALIAPEWSEFVSERHVRHFWRCTDCNVQFETSVYLPPDFKPINDAMEMEEFFSVAVGDVNNLDSWAMGSSTSGSTPLMLL